jgi:hypothetical protein
VWQSRTSTAPGSDGTAETWSTGVNAPYYVKIKRVGDTFTGYTSADGSTWAQIGSAVTISGMSSGLEVGLALSAAGYGSLNTSSFDHIRLTPGAPTLSATLVHAGRIDLSWTDPSGSESGFVLQRRVDVAAVSDADADWTTLNGGAAISASGYHDTGVDPALAYRYRIKSFITDPSFDGPGESDWSAPPVSATTYGLGNGLSATYYPNLDFSGMPQTRTDQEVDFLWAEGGHPIGDMENSTFTAQWTGQILAPATGTYTFKALSDDGARVWVNNQLVLNDWDVHSPSTASGTIELMANNKYDVKVEYFQHYGAAQIGLTWVVPGAGTGTNAVAIPTANLYAQALSQPPDAPDAPEGVYLSFPAAPDAATTPRVDVHWQAVANADVYVIYRSANGGRNWAVAGNTEATAADPTVFRDADGLSPSGSYVYRVQAIGAGGRSDLVDALAAPGGVTATQDGDVVTLTWVDDVSGEAGWRVQRSDDGGPWHPVTQTGPDQTSVEDRGGIVAGHHYAYRLTAVDNFASSLGAVSDTLFAAAFPPAAPAAAGLAPTFYADPDFTAILARAREGRALCQPFRRRGTSASLSMPRGPRGGTARPPASAPRPGPSRTCRLKSRRLKRRSRRPSRPRRWRGTRPPTRTWPCARWPSPARRSCSRSAPRPPSSARASTSSPRSPRPRPRRRSATRARPSPLRPGSTRTARWRCRGSAPTRAPRSGRCTRSRGGSAAAAAGGQGGAFAPIGSVGRRKFTDATVPAGVASVTYQIRAVRSTATGPAAQFVVNFGAEAGGGGGGAAFAGAAKLAA